MEQDFDNDHFIEDALSLPTEQQYRVLLQGLRFDYMEISKHHYMATANQNKSAILARRQLAAQWTTVDGDRPHPWRQLSYNFSANSTAVLGPLEIKTFAMSVVARDDM